MQYSYFNAASYAGYIKEAKPMARLTQQEFLNLLDALRTTTAAHSMAVEIGGKGKVVVLRWALPGSDERTEKKVLLASQSPVLINAAYNAFVGWFAEYQTI